jgi:hypothetical protein
MTLCFVSSVFVSSAIPYAARQRLYTPSFRRPKAYLTPHTRCIINLPILFRLLKPQSQNKLIALSKECVPGLHA